MTDLEHLDRLIELGAVFSGDDALVEHTRRRRTAGSEWWGTPRREVSTRYTTEKPDWFTWKAEAVSFLLDVLGETHPTYQSFRSAAKRRFKSIDTAMFDEHQARMLGTLKATKATLERRTAHPGNHAATKGPNDMNLKTARLVLEEVTQEMKDLLALPPGSDQDRLGRATGVQVRAVTILRKLYDPSAAPVLAMSTLARLGGTWKEARRALEDAAGIVDSTRRDLDAGLLGQSVGTADHTDTPLTTILSLCRRFHLAARQLAKPRRKGKRPWETVDEYDVQDLLHGLLRLQFDDVRPEEATPSHGGRSSRMDFLLKPERIVVEVKMTRDGLGQKEVADELAIDKEHYRSHPDCERLVCFVYDPNGRCSNPVALERDVSSEDGQLSVHIVVAPRGT